MKIEDIFGKYTDKVGQLHIYQRAVKKNTDDVLQQLAKHKASVDTHPELKDIIHSLDNMFFSFASNGELGVFAHRKTDVDGKIKQAYLHKNRQYQWLLAEAYELYEDFVEEAYAYAGFVDIDLWPLHDFGSISYSEIKSKDYAWFLNQARSKKDLPQSALNRLRLKLPEYEKIEKDNALKVDFHFLIIAISLIRHIIVHNGGVVTNRDDFIELILKKAGRSSLGDKASLWKKNIEACFGVGEYSNTIMLLEIPINDLHPLNASVNQWDQISSLLVTAAHALYDALFSKYSSQARA